ncbi:MAG: hypothetical protein ACTSXO_11200 [Candidatus Heimdallarchaeota archaeon]
MTHDSEKVGIALGENFVDFLTRIDKISLEKIVEVAARCDCPEEFAGVVYLLETDLNIDIKLTLSDLKAELERLKKVDSLPPEIETYRYSFAVNEGKWIAFLRGTFFDNLREEIVSLYRLFNKIGKTKGSDLITLATQIMMERQFVAANKIIPVLERWVEEHPKATELDATLQVYASLINKPLQEGLREELDKARIELVKQIEVLGEILSNAEQSNWILRSLIEAEILYEDLNQPLEEVSSKGLADIIIWLMAENYEKKIGDYSTKEDISKLIMRFQLESALGLATASPQAKLEYNLLSLNYKDKMAKPKLAEKIILEAWKEARISRQPQEVGRELLALLMDYSNLPSSFLNKIPKHYEYITSYYQGDKIRLERALKRIKIKGTAPTETEMQEAVILDYLIQFVQNYIVNKMKANPKDLVVPEEKTDLDISLAERDIIDMIDAAIRRGIRSQDKRRAYHILEEQISSLYQRMLNLTQNELSVGEVIIYGIFNMYGIKISRQKAQEFILKHFKRMNVSLETSTKKRIDSVVQKALCIEIEEKILDRNIK